MAADGDRVTANQVRAIASLLTERTHVEAARKAGVSEATLRRYLRNPVFREEYQQAQDRLFQETVLALQRVADKAVKTLDEEMHAADFPAVRVRAAAVVLDRLLQGRQHLANREVVRRLEDLERQLGDEEGSQQPALPPPAPAAEIEGDQPE